MGTRSLTCVFYKGHFVVAQYGQWDGYPEGKGQGLKVLKFLLVSANMERLKDGLKHIYVPTPKELQQFKRENALLEELLEEKMYSGKYSSMESCRSSVYKGWGWPSLSRDTGAGILEIVARATAEKPVPIELDLEFANSGLHCEWAYVVDLDHGMFEVFAGAELKDKIAENRFNDIGGEGDTVPTLVKSFSVTELPATEEEFITALNKASREMEEEKWRNEQRKRKQKSAMRRTTVYSPAPQWITDVSRCSNLGLLNTLSRELREIIYEYVFSVDSTSHGKAKTRCGLLRSTTMVYKEAIPVLYRSRLFGIIFGPEDDTFKYRYIEWDETYFMWGKTDFHCSRCIRYLSANFFDLVQNLQICFTDNPDEDSDSRHDFELRMKNLQRGIFQLCNNLRDSAQLRYLDISIHFICDFEDVSDMACIIEPIKMLRGIQDPNITIYGYQRGQYWEPRWDLTEEYAKYLEQLLMSPHGMPACSADSIQVFEDLFESSESAEESTDPSEPALAIDLEETMIVQYLRDVYNTTDRTALYGHGLPSSNLANDADQQQT